MDEFKIVYGYDRFTNEYIGTQAAHLCQVTKAEYIMPARTTQIAPPENKDGFARVFSADKWEYVEDKRGKAIYSCLTGEVAGRINDLVYAIPEAHTLEVPNKGNIWDNGWKPKPPLTEKELAIIEISRLEAQITPRRLRETILGTGNGWLANQDALIAIERDKLK